MKRALLIAALLAPFAALAAGADPFVKGTADAGASKAAACAACHGAGGNGIINPEWPKLAGQHSSYIAKQLAHFKSGERPVAVMAGQAAALSEQDMADIGAYFAAQPAVPGVATKESLAIGSVLYRFGDASRQLPACGACHGPKGAGNAAAQYPHIGGQNAAYSKNQLVAYKKGKDGGRWGAKNKQAQMMSTVASKLSDEEIAALSAYISGLQ